MDKIINLEIFEDLLINSKNQDNILILSEVINFINNQENNPYNPILLKGKSGCGKTFLLHKIESLLHEKIIYIHSRELLYILNEPNKINEFIAKIDNYECVIFDDLHLFGYEHKAQEELSYIIEMCLNKNKNMFLSINIENKSQELIPLLQSRISMGLIINMPEPNLDIRMRYAQLCMEENSIKLSKEHYLIIARKCNQFRPIRSSVINVKAFQQRTGTLPDIHELDRILSQSGHSSNLDNELILNTVGMRYGYNLKEMRGKKRDPRLVEARQIAMYLCRNLLGEPYAKIGKNFGGKDHSTVIYNIRKIESLLNNDKDMNILVIELTNSCKNSLI